MKSQTLVQLWRPTTKTTTTLKEIQQWFLYYGDNKALYNGYNWILKHEKLCQGVYKVWFEQEK